MGNSSDLEKMKGKSMNKSFNIVMSLNFLKAAKDARAALIQVQDAESRCVELDVEL